MQPWELIALLLAGAVGIGSLAKSSAAAAAASAPALSAADMDLLNRAFRAALATETDMHVLSTFSQKLRAAGFVSYADALDRRTLTWRIAQAPALRAPIMKVTP